MAFSLVGRSVNGGMKKCVVIFDLNWTYMIELQLGNIQYYTKECTNTSACKQYAQINT